MSNNNNKQGRKRQRGNQRASGQPKRKKQKVDPSFGASGSDHSQVLGGTSGQMRTFAPRVGVIEKRELIALVNGTVGFQALKFPINPGLAGTFPVGSPEAKNWTEWRCKRLMVEYIPTVSEFATQGQTGEVAIAVDYNAENDLPTTMQQIEAMHFSGGGIPSRGFQFEASTRFINKADPKYVRSGAPPVGEDLRLYDGGNLYFATNGCTNATQIGKLEVTYHFEVQLPTLLNQGGASSPVSVSSFRSAAAETGGATGVNVNLLLATADFNPLAVVNTAGSFVPVAGSYKIDVWGKCSASINVQFELDVMKNGASVFGATLHPTIGSADTDVASLACSVVVTANGTDAFTFPMKQTGGAAGTQWGGVVWTAL